MNAQKSPSVDSWSRRLARWILAVVFIYAGVLKIGSPQDFADSIAAYHLLPFAVINLVALGLPVFELVCGLLLITGYFRPIGAFGVLLMLGAFTIALVSVLARGLSIDCGCFGTHSWFDTNPWIALVRDGLLLALAVMVYWSDARTMVYGDNMSPVERSQ